MSADLSPELRDALAADPFANWIGAALDEVSAGHARMSLTVRPEHCGPHGLTHGGTIMALAEAALAAATHAHNRVHLALNVNVTFHSATRPGDHLIATVDEQRAGGRTAGYAMTVVDQGGTLVATCQAVVYRTREPFVELAET
ncbi:MAG: PaaI family thioesterase [Anaerolineales bacterium]|nr:PaaI family thioesterase [Anaerolineales bacterium]MCB9128127.1 PaaI family thioesterase [Ardenticatenales bacterium]MCB9171837.1 PaaI family thioesterase [Ardenticatenales bacterium]